MKTSGILLPIAICLHIVFNTPACLGQKSDTLQGKIDTLQDLKEVVITSQHRPTHYTKALQNIIVIDKSKWENKGYTQLQDVVTTLPGVRLNVDPLLGTSISMRGISSDNVAILIDGVPVIGRLNGGIDISQLPLQNVERIEIINGPQSNLYGNNAAAGVLNLITKKSQAKKYESILQYQKESIGIDNAQANIGLRLGKFLIRTGGRLYNYSQYPIDSMRQLITIKKIDGGSYQRKKYPFNPKSQKSFSFLAKYLIKDHTKIDAGYNYNREEVALYDIKRRPVFKPYSNDQFFTTERSDFTLNLSTRVKKILLDANLAWNKWDRVLEEKRYNFDSLSYAVRPISQDTTLYHSIFSKVTASYAYKKSTMIGGMTLTSEQAYGDRIKPIKGNKAGIWESAWFYDHQYKLLSQVTLGAGLRMTHHTVYGLYPTLSASAKYQITSRTVLRSSYATGYRNPSIKELYLEFIDVNHYILGNIELKPEKTNDAQLNVKHNFNKVIQADLGIYQTTIRDQITLAQYEQARYTYFNANRFNTQGVQAAIALKLASINYTANYNYSQYNAVVNTDASNVKGSIHDFFQSCSITLAKDKLNLSINHRLNGRQPFFVTDVDGKISVLNSPSYQMLDFASSYNLFKSKAVINAGIKNILDVRQLEVNSSDGAIHLASGRMINPGRSYYLGLKLSL